MSFSSCCRSLFIVLFCCCCITAPRLSYGGDHTTLIVKTFPTVSDKGMVFFALFNRDKGFPVDWTKAVRYGRCMPERGTAEVSFAGLVPGDYAVALYHDENENGVVDLNFLGLPVEGWGVSNNVRPTFRAPSFTESSVHIRGNKHLVEIKLNY